MNKRTTETIYSRGSAMVYGRECRDLVRLALVTRNPQTASYYAQEAISAARKAVRYSLPTWASALCLTVSR